ncbi:hypothetical protein CVT24_007113 [Panaeolus cyanescens]|uniref:GmrSD restriction endonucleases C-terminal domain-containing protein n=1 Tax=Panaeolus cyanescens TaxID=181874 RepID=A0A409YNZ1_9AGAR|nr:hypothetical protein CVT24_007113 [Panaeolus cyanescens]
MFLRLFMLATFLVSCSIVRADLPTPVDATTAISMLGELVVAVDSNVPAYNRNFFKTWDIISDKVINSMYAAVLIRDGTGVVTDSSCKPTSGNWVSPYDGVPTNLASDLDIDHLVPLKEAWLSGARDWTNATREAFANDLTRPQLVAVTDNLNESKGDRDVTHFLPPLASYVCTYVLAWVQVKHFWNLTIDAAEQVTLQTQLAKC